MAGTRDYCRVPTDIRKRLGLRVRNLRRDRCWTQVDLAELLGIDRSYLSEIETGKKDPSLTILKTMADGFGMDLGRFLKGL